MPPAVIEAAFALQPGQISPVVQSEIGYHVVKVEAREADRPLSPEMLLYAQQRAFEAWLAQQRAQARIERYQDQERRQ
jgi:peptidyl-prolyl cis-trans isomerase C